MLETRIFDRKDQHLFARITGDFNPMHLDDVAARRTLAGAPVVHGIHNFLWLLDSIAKWQPDLKDVVAFKVHFGKMLYLGELARVTILRQDGRQIRAKVSVGNADIMQVILRRGSAVPSASTNKMQALGSEILQPLAPADVNIADMKGQSGRLAFASEPEQISRLFAHASRLVGARRVAALGCCTRLVGMVLPGLHSMFSGLDLSMVEDVAARGEINYEVETVNEDLNFVRLAVAGAGLTGHLDAFNRPTPTAQPQLASIAPFVHEKEFDGAVALIVGGSRGLGELVAKIVAAGGGKVIVTYVAGKQDAEKVAKEINGEGGQCEVLAYDVNQQPDLQLKELKTIPTHVYYFATPSIFRRRSATYSPKLFEDFNSYYVTGFHNLIDFASREWPSEKGIGVFYPSSTALDQRPENMTEYSMSKAAGEILCADLAKYTKNLRIILQRLPRLLTDQTASVSEVESADALAVMIPIVRQVQKASALAETIRS